MLIGPCGSHGGERSDRQPEVTEHSQTCGWTTHHVVCLFFSSFFSVFCCGRGGLQVVVPSKVLTYSTKTGWGGVGGVFWMVDRFYRVFNKIYKYIVTCVCVWGGGVKIVLKKIYPI